MVANSGTAVTDWALPLLSLSGARRITLPLSRLKRHTLPSEAPRLLTTAAGVAADGNSHRTRAATLASLGSHWQRPGRPWGC